MKRQNLFLATLTITLLACFLYVPWRLNHYFQTNSILMYAYGLLVVIAMTLMFSSIHKKTAAGKTAFTLASLFLGLFSFLGVFTILLDLINLILPLPFTGFIILYATIITTTISFIIAQTTIVKHYTLALKHLKKPVKLVHFTDLHLGHFRQERYLRQLIIKINKEQPDLVLFTGDLIDTRTQLRKQLFKQFKHVQAPMIAIEGNHDVHTGSEEVFKLLRQNNVKLLTNQTIQAKGLTIAGLRYMKADKKSRAVHQGYDSTNKDELQKLKLAKDKPSILLQHEPYGIPYAAKKGFSLVLAGHTHAGQFFPVTLLVRLLYKYNKGWHKLGNTQVYVSQGAGTFGPPYRLGTRNEVAVMSLVPKK